METKLKNHNQDQFETYIDLAATITNGITTGEILRLYSIPDEPSNHLLLELYLSRTISFDFLVSKIIFEK